MSALRMIARWSAGPAIGIALGLVLGAVADKRPAETPRPVTLSAPAEGGAVVRDQPARPAGTLIAAAGD